MKHQQTDHRLKSVAFAQLDEATKIRANESASNEALNCGFLSRCWSVSPSMSFLSFYAFLSSSFFVGTCMIFHIYMSTVALCYAAFACMSLEGCIEGGKGWQSVC